MTPLTDDLAVRRTQLANERTWLAYVRTALTLLIAGISFIQFFGMPAARLAGWAFLPLSMYTLALGWSRYARMRRVLQSRPLP